MATLWLSGVIIGGVIVHVGARRRDVENEQRRQRVDYLVGAYRTLTRAAHRELSGERAETFEDALSDVILLGNDDQIRLARETIKTLADRLAAQMDALLVSLRDALRGEVDLRSDDLRQVPVVRMTWGTEERPSPLRLDDAREVSFADRAALTGASVASAASASSQPTSGERRPNLLPASVDLSHDIARLQELATAAGRRHRDRLWARHRNLDEVAGRSRGAAGARRARSLDLSDLSPAG